MSASENVVNFADGKATNGVIYSDNRLVAFIQKLADFLLQIELLWSAAALVYVYLSLIPVVPGGYLSWVALGATILPFIMRKLRKGYFSVRTAFDVPILIFMVGAVIGFVYSIDKDLSLRVFQSCLAGMFSYYVIVNYRYPRFTLLFLFMGACCLGITILLFTFGSGPIEVTGISPISGWLNRLIQYAPQVPQPADHANPLFGWTYNTVLLPILILSIMVGIVIFDRRWLLRMISLGIILFLLFIVLATMGAGLGRLFEGTTWDSRLPLWEDTVSAIRANSWFVGLGLGMPSLFAQGVFQDWFTHSHNAYLELYANIGVLGLVSAFVSVVIIVWFVYKLIRSPRESGWYAVTVGLLLSLLVLAVFSVFTTSLSGHLGQGKGEYYYVVSLLPWILGASLVVSYMLTRQGSR